MIGLRASLTVTRFAGISIGIHVALFLAAWLVVFPRIAQGPGPRTSRSAVMLMEIVKASPGPGSRQARTARPRGRHPAPVRLKDLGLPLGPSSKSARSQEATEAEGSGEPAAGELGKWAGVFQAIYQRIDSHLAYPDELRSAGFEGRINARIRIEPDGRYERGLAQITGGDPYLRVHVKRTLRKALEEPLVLPTELRLAGKPLVLDCSFRFEITQNGDAGLSAAQRFVRGRRLSFYRSFYRSMLEWDIGPLHGLGPVQVGIDPMWVLRKAKELLSHDAKIDPLDRYRDDPDG